MIMDTGIDVTYTRIGKENTMMVLYNRAALDEFGLLVMADNMSPDPSAGKVYPRPPKIPITISMGRG